MLYKALIKKVITFMNDNPDHKGVKDIKTVAEGVKMCPEQMLLNYDIRNIGLLRGMVPEAFPKKMRKGPLVGSQNIHDAWRVVPFTSTTNMREKQFL